MAVTVIVTGDNLTISPLTMTAMAVMVVMMMMVGRLLLPLVDVRLRKPWVAAHLIDRVALGRVGLEHALQKRSHRHAHSRGELEVSSLVVASRQSMGG